MKQAVVGVWAAGSWAEPRRAMCFVRAWGGRESFLVGRDRLRARAVAVRLYAEGCLAVCLSSSHGGCGWPRCKPPHGREEAGVGAVIGDLLPLAVGVAISPMPIVAVILMLLSRQAGRQRGRYGDRPGGGGPGGQYLQR